MFARYPSHGLLVPFLLYCFYLQLSLQLSLQLLSISLYPLGLSKPCCNYIFRFRFTCTASACSGSDLFPRHPVPLPIITEQK